MLRLFACLSFAVAVAVNIAVVKAEEHAEHPSDKRLFWGDTHVHTNLSIDAFTAGNRSLGPKDAYKFAKGEPIELPDGQVGKINRPLDFMVVADHAEFLGGLNHLVECDFSKASESSDLQREICSGARSVESFSERDPQWKAAVLNYHRETSDLRKKWMEVIDAAEAHYEPGSFTSFIGFEWSPFAENSNASLHRVVVFRDGADLASQVLPFSRYESQRPEDLWSYMDRYAMATGGDLLAIPHNGNLSSGRMFLPLTSEGAAMNAAHAAQRRRWEPLYEITQIKGDGETHPLLSPTDEFADFERWSWATDTAKPDATTAFTKQYEYARSGLHHGLHVHHGVGENPFEMGFVGSTDTHLSASGIAEDAFLGKLPASLPGPDRIKQSGWHGWSLSASGLAAVWAEDNTREAIFAAMKRREVYATTGPRIHLRFFGRYDLKANVLEEDDWTQIAYKPGVPMGSVLPANCDAGGLRFFIEAARDDESAPIEVVEVIKGWRSADGETKEMIFKVAQTDPGNGEDRFLLQWKDPDFSPDVPAFYYVRVLEAETPRWSTLDAQRYGVKLPDTVPRSIRERAYSSPIWYYPSSCAQTPAQTVEE
ncbi:MAG: DUF3604 domain-containing protein [Pseudomonadota bacterium]